MTTTRANLYGVAAILMWSTLIALVRSVSQAFGVAGGTALIFTAGSIVLVLRQGFPKIRSMHPLYVWGCGAAFVLYEILMSQSIGLATSSSQTLEVGMINYLWPCAIVVISIWINKERMRWWVWLGILCSLAGIYLCITSNSDVDLAGFARNIMATPLPYGMAFVAAILWGFYCNLSRRYGEGQNAVPFFFIVIASTLWVRFFITGSTITWPGWTAWAELVYIGVVFAVSYACWETGIQKGNMLLLAVISYFTPVFSMLFMCMWLKTMPGTGFWIGVALVVAGSLVCWTATRKSG
ncbi:aromatic amino acid DMT transporter YddG [Oxalobacter sp. OttesenSCG-928-P03]|nr:aromatic amino acid DMT transporter YddG [Oxalobacter sp. OttesenSCG-928-P03]